MRISLLAPVVASVLYLVLCSCRLLDGRAASRPVELVKDGEILLLVERMLHLWELDTVRIPKVKGHADEASVRA